MTKAAELTERVKALVDDYAEAYAAVARLNVGWIDEDYASDVFSDADKSKAALIAAIDELAAMAAWSEG